MIRMYQASIKKSISFSGVGLHTGLKVQVTIKPAPVNSGIVFLIKNSKIKLSPDNVTDTTRSVSIGRGKHVIRTVEHLSAALFSLGINNLFIEMNEPELPALDGSALGYLKQLLKSGAHTQKAAVKPFYLTRSVSLFEKDSFIMGLPSDRLKITCGIDFDHPDLKEQSIHFSSLSLGTFKKEIGPARTFGFEKEVKALYKRGLALGGTLNNAVVLTEKGYLNKRLRFKDECIRHKVLDFIGMLGTLNCPVHAHFIVYKSSHRMDLKYIKKLIRRQ